MKYGYYPGCSLERNAGAYHQSTMAVSAPLGLDMVEVDDWNCCGATEYFSINLLPAYALVGRNLALAQSQGVSNQLVAPCSACFLNLTKTDRYMADSPDLAAQVNTALAAGGLHYTPGSVGVRHLLDVIVNDVGYDVVAARVAKPLAGLRVAAYYGCLIVRPGYGGVFDDPEHPTTLDRLMRVLGAEVVDFPLKAQCCGGHMTQISQEVALEMIRRLLKNAADYEADVIATLCPMCQLNLDVYQTNVNQFFKTDYMIPALYFTQLMGLAFGASAIDLGIGKEFVDARPALAKIGVTLPAPEGARKAGASKEALPMPRMEEKPR
jgi:heterodisulfide reductase subunit B